MYKKIETCLKPPIKGKILGISGIENLRSLISEKAEITYVQYPEVDLQDLPYVDYSFDYIISDQVIEHLENPKKGGIAIHTTCFINYVHQFPRDYWRFSPEALKYLCKDFSEVLQCDGWGNRIAILLCLTSNRFRFIRIPKYKWSIRRLFATWNEQRYPIVTWAVVKK